MAISFEQNDLFGRSTFQRGMQASRLDTSRSIVRRVGILRGVSDTMAGNQDALDFCQNNYSTFDPVENLPRKAIQIKRLSGDKVLAVVLYARDGGSNVPDDPNDTFVVATSESAVARIPWYSTHETYDSDNYTPDGSVSFAHPEKLNVTRQVVEIRVIAPIILTSTPWTTAVTDRVNATNNDTFSLGGRSWPVSTVKFVGGRIVSAVRVGSSVVHDVRWQFNLREETFNVERIGLDGRIYDQLDARSSLAFSNQFPTS